MATQMQEQTQAPMNLEQGDLDSWEIPSVQNSNRSFEPIPDGVYDLEITTISDPFDSTFGGKTKKQVIIEFTIENDPEYSGQTVREYYTLSMHEQAKLYGLAKAVFGRELDVTQAIRPSWFMNKHIRGLIETPEAQEGRRAWPKLIRPMARPPARSNTVTSSPVPADPETGELPNF